MGKRTVASVVVLFGIVSVVSAGAVMLFTQSLPTVNVQSPSVRADCLSLSSTPGTIVRGVGQDKSYVLFNCNGNKAIDFVASASPTPVFSLGVGYLNISLVIHSSSLPTTGPVCNPASIGVLEKRRPPRQRRQSLRLLRRLRPQPAFVLPEPRRVQRLLGPIGTQPPSSKSLHKYSGGSANERHTPNSFPSPQS